MNKTEMIDHILENMPGIEAKCLMIDFLKSEADENFLSFLNLRTNKAISKFGEYITFKENKHANSN